MTLFVFVAVLNISDLQLLKTVDYPVWSYWIYLKVEYKYGVW